MMEGLASGAYSTHARAGVNAFIIYASSVARALRADRALGSTSWWGALEVVQARATGLTIRVATLTIWPAWRRFARVGSAWRGY